MTFKEVEIPKDVWIGWQNDVLPSIEERYAVGGIDGLVEYVKQLEMLQFEYRAKTERAKAAAREKLAASSSDSFKKHRDSLITDPDFKIEVKEKPSKVPVASRAEKAAEALKTIDGDKLQEMLARLNAMKGNK